MNQGVQGPLFWPGGHRGYRRPAFPSNIMGAFMKSTDHKQSKGEWLGVENFSQA